MRVGAVICEYNPFHNGHAYQLEYMKKELGISHVVAVMSGGFVQRGEPAVFNKYVRTRAALLNGADIVIELPTVFAAASAGDFAMAAVTAVQRTGIADVLCFGTEGEVSIDGLRRLARAKEDTGGDIFRKMIKEGKTYPEAVCLASGLDGEYLRLPNNILASEYLRALGRLGDSEGCRIEPVPIRRVGCGYNDSPGTDGIYASAGTIRQIIVKGDAAGSLAAYVPGNVLGYYSEEIAAGHICRNNDLSAMLGMRLLEEKYGGCGASEYEAGGGTGRAPGGPGAEPEGISTEGLAGSTPGTAGSRKGVKGLESFMDVSPEIAGRLMKTAERPMSFDERVEAVKTRQYTRTRVSRALLHIVLGITREEYSGRRKAGYISYLRVLGFTGRAVSDGLLKRLKECAGVPVVVKPSGSRELIGRDAMYDGLWCAAAGCGGPELGHSPVIVR